MKTNIIMPIRVYILLLLTATASSVSARSGLDSLQSEALRWKAPWVSFSNYFEYNPSATFAVPVKHYNTLDASYEASHADAGMHAVQDGNGFSAFRLGAESYQQQGRLRFFGNASYSDSKRTKTGWRDVEDYQLLNPYLVADSVGGDYKNESYAFSGGVSYALRNWELGIRGGYEGGQSYKQVDPRPLNSVSTIRVNPGVTLHKGNWRAGLFGEYIRYRQNVDIDVEKSDRKIYFYLLEGFGIYNRQFSVLSDNFSRIYRGNLYNAGLHLDYSTGHQSTGFLAWFRNNYLQADEDDRRIPYHIEHHEISGQLTHERDLLGQRLFLKGFYTFRQLIGNEAQYQPVTVNTNFVVWQYASSSDRYQSRENKAGFSALLADKKGNRFSLWEQIDGLWQSTGQHYYYPYYNEYTENLTAAATVGFTSPGRKLSMQGLVSAGFRKNISASLTQDDSNVIVNQLLLPDFAFASADIMFYKAELTCIFPVSTNTAARISARGGWQTSDGNTAWNARLVVGLNF
jgi:hypothetical protein